jgi:hypothetical protein
MVQDFAVQIPAWVVIPLLLLVIGGWKLATLLWALFK